MSYITAVTATGDRAAFVAGGSTVKDVITGLGLADKRIDELGFTNQIKNN